MKGQYCKCNNVSIERSEVKEACSEVLLECRMVAS